jgi:predicted RNA binding protein YcfA (HicA-like mRNA interferase family)
MGRQTKLFERLRTKPTDFTWQELEALLRGLGYEQERGSGSRRKFYNKGTGALISLHEPHPRKILKRYQVNDVLSHLKERGVI